MENYIMETKCCSYCKIEKQVNNFHKHSETKDKLDSLCKNCHSIMWKM
jgi:hypothetical protein